MAGRAIIREWRRAGVWLHWPAGRSARARISTSGRTAMTRLKCGAVASMALLVAGCTGMAQAPSASSGMTFFITGTGSGKGADYGGLAGADKHCQTLAEAAGAGNHTWHAYLSTQGAGAVNARDRIGKGPWRNAKGVVIANDVAELHGSNILNKQTALTEKG